MWKNVIIHEEIATTPALAACAAGQQGRFWEMEDAIWASVWDLSKDPPEPRASNMKEFEDKLNQAAMVKLAEKLKLEPARFVADLNGATCRDRIAADEALMGQLGVHGTPGFFINGRYIGGAQDIDAFKALIDEEMNKADAAIKGGVKPDRYYDSIVAGGKKTVE